MTVEQDLRAQWLATRDRLAERHLLVSPGASLSLRLPGGEAMWFGAVDAAPERVRWQGASAAPGAAAVHAAIYRARPDVGAVVRGGGPFGLRVADFGGALPGVFDEQVRHLGRMGAASGSLSGLVAALAEGGNAAVFQGHPLCLGTTCARMAMNAELFEKCAKAYVLAAATGGPVRPLPWIVRTVANRRLRKDEQRAAARFARGLLPEETRGY